MQVTLTFVSPADFSLSSKGHGQAEVPIPQPLSEPAPRPSHLVSGSTPSPVSQAPHLGITAKDSFLPTGSDTWRFSQSSQLHLPSRFWI